SVLAMVSISINWKTAPVEGRIEVVNGRLIKLSGGASATSGTSSANHFVCPAAPSRVVLSIEATDIQVGAAATIIRVKTASSSFSFFLRDVRSDFPIFLPGYGLAVIPADDQRSFEQIANDVFANRRLTRLQQIELEPEESFETAASQTRELKAPIWLGISRDVRIFEFGLRQPMLVTDYIQ